MGLKTENRNGLPGHSLSALSALTHTGQLPDAVLVRPGLSVPVSLTDTLILFHAVTADSFQQNPVYKLAKQIIGLGSLFRR